MLSWAILWDVIKVAIFPVVGLLYTMVKQKINKLDTDIEKLQVKSDLLEKQIIRMETTFVTQDQLRHLLGDFLQNMEKANELLEKRIDKTMDLKIDPIKDLLSQLVDKR